MAPVAVQTFLALEAALDKPLGPPGSTNLWSLGKSSRVANLLPPPLLNGSACCWTLNAAKGLDMEAPEGGPQLAGNAGDPPVVVKLCAMSQLAPFLHDPFFEKKGPNGFTGAKPRQSDIWRAKPEGRLMSPRIAKA